MGSTDETSVFGSGGVGVCALGPDATDGDNGSQDAGSAATIRWFDVSTSRNRLAGRPFRFIAMEDRRQEWLESWLK